MHIALRFGFMCLAAVALHAQGGPGPSGGSGGGGSVKQVSLHIPDETAPPGGVAQMKFMVTEPTPISSGRPGFAVDSSMFDSVWGIELFNPTGDVNGVAMVGGSFVNVSYITSSGAQGNDYPIMTVALHIRPDAAPGSQTQFTLDPSSTWILGLLGAASFKPIMPAKVTVGGTISITNIVPGGGLQPAGITISVQGIGFQSNTQVQLSGIKASSIQVVSPQEIQIVLAEAADMTGKKVQVVNPDGSQDTYFSYLRGIPLGQSSRSLLSTAVPIFSSITHSMAQFAPMGTAWSTQFTGVALQNPSVTPATVTVELHSLLGTLLGTSTTVIPGGYRMMRETSELTQGIAPDPGSYVVVSSTQPVQMFAFLGDEAAGTVSPFTAILTTP